MNPRAQNIALGAIWNYGAQFSTIAFQFFYAAATSRLVSAEGFGRYAVALSAAALINLVFAGGIGQAVSRIEALKGPQLSGLHAISWAVGALGAVVLWFTAPAWSSLWGQPAATSDVQIMSLTVLFGAAAGIVTGLMRRKSEFKVLAIVTLLSNVAGMAAGLCAVLIFRSSESLLVSPIVALLLSFLGLFYFNRKLLWFWASFQGLGHDLHFSARVTATNVLSYVSGNIGLWSISNALGASPVGQINRAGTVSTIPLYQIQASVTQVLYPEFRHDAHSPSRAQKLWTDLLVFTAWLVLPMAAIGLVVVPALIPVLFGPGWTLAADISRPLMVAGGLQILVALLAAGLEATGKFRAIINSQLVLIPVNGFFAWVTFQTHSWVPFAIASITSLAVQHVLHVILASRLGYLRPKLLIAGYLRAIIFGVLVAALSVSLEWFVRDNQFSPMSFAVAFVVVALASWILIIRFKSSEPIRIAQSYGLLRGLKR
jgi:O-antigen/teichoic acid export membrane protein